MATVLDTPGQEIFYRMRTNGARVADAVVLVVSGTVVGMSSQSLLEENVMPVFNFGTSVCFSQAIIVATHPTRGTSSMRLA